MQRWKSWQILFLAYVFLLDVIVLGTLAYIVFTYDYGRTRRPASPTQIVVVLPTPAPTSTLTPSPAPTNTDTPALSQVERPVLSQVERPTPIPSVNIPPAPMPSASATASPPTPTPFPTATSSPTASATPTLQPTATATATSTPTPQPTATSTPTNTPQPTATFTTTPTRTPQPTASVTPRPTATSTREPTSTPRPTATPQPTATATLKRTSTPQPTATATSTPTLTPPPTATATCASTPRSTATATPSPTHIPSPTPVLVAAKSTPVDTGSVAALNSSAATDSSPAKTLLPIEAIALTNGSIALSWPPAVKARPYHIYSDMGSDYGVYIYKAQTAAQPAFVDEGLRPGLTYRYRITQVSATEEKLLAQAAVTTLGNESGNAQNGTAVGSVMAQPTALPPDAVLLGLVSDNNFTDNFNTLTIAGEVRNDSTQEVGQTSITITFYDAAGAVIDAANGKTMLEEIPPGDTSPFLLTLTRPDGLASYSLRAVARPVTPKLRAQLTVIETKRFEDEAGFFHIKGIIENVGNTTAKRAKVVAVIYGREGRVININFAYATPPKLAPGEQAGYDVIFTYYPKYYTQAVISFEE